MTDQNTLAARPLALVTGGSNGIGLELARELARGGHDLLIVSENGAELDVAARELRAEGAGVETCTADLAREGGVASLLNAAQARPIEVLCVNAGVGLGGPFLDTELDRELSMIDLNVRGAVQLAKPVVRSMVERGAGRILFTSSIAATMPDPFEAVYGGTKAFLRWFGEALREELRDTGVTVTVLMPGVTETNFFRRAGMLDTRAGTMKGDDPAVVAKQAVAGLMAGKDKVIPTVKNKVMARVADMLPDVLAAKGHRSLSEPGSARKDEGGGLAVPIAAAAAAGVGLALFAGWKSRQDGRAVDREPVSPEAGFGAETRAEPEMRSDTDAQAAPATVWVVQEEVVVVDTPVAFAPERDRGDRLGR